MRRFPALVLTLLLFLLPFASQAEGFSAQVKAVTDGETLLRGYDSGSESYVYLTFGNYPYEKDGTPQPCLWRVLSIENGYAFLLNEYVLDFQPFHVEKVDQPDWSGYALYDWMNTTMVETMFTQQEKDCLRYVSEMGWLFILSNREFMTRDYGFRPILTEIEWERECAPTPYAYSLPGSYIEKNGKTWYWTRTCRNTAAGGYEHIVGYNGHISMAGHTRIGGVRPACFLDCARLDQATGTGTAADPYVFQILP